MLSEGERTHPAPDFRLQGRTEDTPSALRFSIAVEVSFGEAGRLLSGFKAHQTHKEE
jgi:hypothetical protein